MVSEHLFLSQDTLLFLSSYLDSLSCVSLFIPLPQQTVGVRVCWSLAFLAVERDTRVPHPKNIPISLDGDAGGEHRAREEDSQAGHHYELSPFPVSLETWVRGGIWVHVHFLRNFLGLDDF